MKMVQNTFGVLITFFIFYTNSYAFDLNFNHLNVTNNQDYRAYDWYRADLGSHTGQDYSEGVPTSLSFGQVSLLTPTGTNSTNDTCGSGDCGMGNSVVVKYLKSNGDYVYALYAHLANFDVEFAKHVVAEQKIGTMGDTDTDLVHLHFEIKDDNMLGNSEIQGWGYIPYGGGNDIDPEDYNYHAPIGFMNNDQNTISLPILSRDTNSPSVSNYNVYGIANETIYGYLNVSGTFDNSAIVVRDFFDRSLVENQGTLDDAHRFLDGTHNGIVDGLYGDNSTYSEGDYLFVAWVLDEGTNKFGYPVKFSFVNLGDIIIDNDQQNADDNSTNDTQTEPAYNGDAGSKVPGYFLTADLHQGRSGKSAQWKPYQSGNYQIYVHIPEYGATATSVRYVIYEDGTDDITKNATQVFSTPIDQSLNAGQWVQLVSEGGETTFDLNDSGYVGIYLNDSIPTDGKAHNYDITDDPTNVDSATLYVAFDAIKFVQTNPNDGDSGCAIIYMNKDITFPCVEFQGDYYQVKLTLHDYPDDPDGYYWTLTKENINYGQYNESCVTADENLNFSIPCLEFNGKINSKGYYLPRYYDPNYTEVYWSTKSSQCGAYVAPGVWKEFDCYNLAAIGKTTNDDPFTPSWRLTGGYWQWGRKGPDESQWYYTNTANFAHGPTGLGTNEANDGSISNWDIEAASDDAWCDSSKTDNDPCPSGYRVPTKSQWEGVVDNNTQSTVGTWDYDATNYSYARFFGPDLMLPAVGCRCQFNGPLLARGDSGYYWSSSKSGSSKAWNLSSHSWNPDMEYGSRLWGHSVRCVADDSASQPSVLTVDENSVSIYSGESDTVFISGGTGYYTASTSDTKVAVVTLNGNSVEITGLSPGTTTIKVEDSGGAVVSFSVSVTSSSSSSGTCGAYVAPGVWKEFDCYNLASIGKTTSDEPFTPSWRLIGGYWQWGRKGPDESQWYDTNTKNFAHGPTGSGSSEANETNISSWDSTSNGAWSDSSKTANDPCPSGYRVPTISQWSGVIDNNTQSTVGTWNNDDTNYSSGRFFGSDLMLPAGGFRKYLSGELDSRGYYGYYWSSSKASSAHAACLRFDSGTAGSNVLYVHRSGQSVRCVAE